MTEPPSTPPERPDEIAMLAADRRRHRTLTLLKALGASALLVLFFGGLYMLTSSTPPVDAQDVRAQEQRTLLLTNDPQCRELIAGVTRFGQTFKDAVPTLEDVTAEQVQQVTAARKRVGELRQELERLRILSTKAALRYEESTPELKAWFKHVETELRLLDLRGEVNLKVLDAQARGETYVEPRPKPRGRIMGQEEPEIPSLQSRRDASVLAIFDEIRNFRIWHTAAHHPCGAADAAETPWTPPPPTP